jgi:hypothetical protein
VAILAGALSLAVFGLLDHPNILAKDVTLARTGAARLLLSHTVHSPHFFVYSASFRGNTLAPIPTRGKERRGGGDFIFFLPAAFSFRWCSV